MLADASAWRAVLADAATAVELIEEMTEEEDALEMLRESADALGALHLKLGVWERTTLMGGQWDASDASLSISAGVGGIDAQDWAEMLLRMYERWGEKNDYKVALSPPTPPPPLLTLPHTPRHPYSPP